MVIIQEFTMEEIGAIYTCLTVAKNHELPIPDLMNNIKSAIEKIEKSFDMQDITSETPKN